MGAVYHHFIKNPSIGVGNNFGRFSDDLTDLTFGSKRYRALSSMTTRPATLCLGRLSASDRMGHVENLSLRAAGAFQVRARRRKCPP